MTARTKTKPTSPTLAPQTGRADSLEQAATLLSLPKAALTWAKNDGCPAFRHSHVYLDEFKNWWPLNKTRMADDSDLPSKDVLDRQLKRQRLTRQQKDDEREDGKWIPLKEVHSTLAAIASEMNAALHAMPRELTPKLLGLDAIGTTQVLQTAVCRTIEIFQHGADKYLPPESEWFYEI